MNFTASSLIAGLLFGVVGVWLLRTGKREANLWFTLSGALMMIYPFFSPNAWADWGIGIGLCVFAYVNRRN